MKNKKRLKIYVRQCKENGRSQLTPKQRRRLKKKEYREQNAQVSNDAG